MEKTRFDRVPEKLPLASSLVVLDDQSLIKRMIKIVVGTQSSSDHSLILSLGSPARLLRVDASRSVGRERISSLDPLVGFAR